MYHKLSHGAAFYTLNGKNVNVMLEFCLNIDKQHSDLINILYCLTHKAPNKNAADDILIFYFYLSKKIRLDFSCESSAQQRFHLKHQVLFLRQTLKKIFMNVVCCITYFENLQTTILSLPIFLSILSENKM